MQMHKFISVLLAAAGVLTLCACGGENIIGQNLGGSSAVSTTGTITAFGSVVVDGVHYDTSHATITRNGVSVSETELAVGQIARIVADSADDTDRAADRIDVDDRSVGPITSINNAAGSLVALGQTVTVDSATSFDRDISPSGLSGLAVGEVIDVSGFSAADGHIRATRIEPGSTTTFQVIGEIAGVDTTGETFAINALTVDYSSATVSGFASGVPAEGDLVEVVGAPFDAASTTLTATSVAPARDETSDADEGDDIEREGLITRFASATDFDVAGRPVTTTSNTEFSGGTAADLALNERVAVAGEFNANDMLEARQVAIHAAGIAEIEGEVTAVDTTSATVTLLGATVTVTLDTRLEDNSDAEVAVFDLTDVDVGDTVDVRGFENPVGSGNITATRLERETPDTVVVVGEFFEATTPPQFTILGITIDTTTAAFTRDRNTTLTSGQFFTQAPGHVVFAVGTLNGTTIDAATVDLSTRDDREDQ
jgi:hypothetical protein